MRCSGALVSALLGVALAGSPAAAVSAGAAVYSPQQALPAQTIQQFLADPAALLAQYPNGGPQLIARVRDLAASDSATLNALIGLLATANPNQSTAIGTALGQVALMAVKTDQAYANQIQEAIAGASQKRGGVGAQGGTGRGSAQPKIGSAVTTKDQVEGVTEKGTHSITAGSEVYLDELVRTGVSGMAQLLFADRTNLSVGPVAEIRLDKFVYDPNGGSGNVVLVASEGAFRFITGAQPSRDYTIKTPFATMGVRGTEFIAVLPPRAGAVPDKSCAVEDIQLLHGEVLVTTISGKVVPLATANTKLSVDCQGNTQGPTPTAQPLMNFADLGSPVTNLALADAPAAFAAATGNSGIGATGGGDGGGGGGGGEEQTGQNGGGGGGLSGGGSPNLKTFVGTTPGNLFTLNFTSSSGSPASNQSVSPH